MVIGQSSLSYSPKKYRNKNTHHTKTKISEIMSSCKAKHDDELYKPHTCRTYHENSPFIPGIHGAKLLGQGTGRGKGESMQGRAGWGGAREKSMGRGVAGQKSA